MSLLSTFHAGDPTLIEAAARKGDLEFSRLPGVRGIDFSGGISRPFLFPEDFQTLTGGGADSFWSLKDNNLLKGEEQGLHRVPAKEVDRSLSPARARRLLGEPTRHRLIGHCGMGWSAECRVSCPPPWLSRSTRP
jgi:hypothetical protein